MHCRQEYMISYLTTWVPGSSWLLDYMTTCYLLCIFLFPKLFLESNFNLWFPRYGIPYLGDHKTKFYFKNSFGNNNKYIYIYIQLWILIKCLITLKWLIVKWLWGATFWGDWGLVSWTDSLDISQVRDSSGDFYYCLFVCDFQGCFFILILFVNLGPKKTFSVPNHIHPCSEPLPLWKLAIWGQHFGLAVMEDDCRNSSFVE